MMGRSFSCVIVYYCLVMWCIAEGGLLFEPATPQYSDYMKRIAKARRSYEAKVYLEQKNEIHDLTPPEMKFAAEETGDHWINKLDNRYAAAAKQYSNVKTPKPIVDTAGQKELNAPPKAVPLPLNIVLVNLFEGFSKFLNQLVEKPFELVSKTWNKGLKTLDLYGGKILNLNN